MSSEVNKALMNKHKANSCNRSAAYSFRCASVGAIDIEMARILRVLDETGQSDNTIIVYTA